jgi:hypothetical protein
MMLSELSLITQDRSYIKISCSYFHIAAEVSGQEPLWPGSSILVLLESILQQFTSSSWITCVEGKDGVERSARSGASVKRLRSTACSRAGGDDVLRVNGSRSRVKRSSGVEGEVIEATACFGGEAVEGALDRRRRAPGVGGVEDLKRASGENLLSVERAARAPDIYIGGHMRDMHSLRCITDFLGASCNTFR